MRCWPAITQEASQKAVVTLRWVREINKTPGRNSLTFQAPDAPVNQWEVVIPAEERPGRSQRRPRRQGAADSPKPASPKSAARRRQQPASPGLDAQGRGRQRLDALINVTSRLDATLEEGIVRTQAHVTFAVSRAPIAALAILFPREHRVTNVFDPNIRELARV